MLYEVITVTAPTSVSGAEQSVVTVNVTASDSDGDAITKAYDRFLISFTEETDSLAMWVVSDCFVDRIRITSYNVCYTKLLRSPRQKVALLGALQFHWGNPPPAAAPTMRACRVTPARPRSDA